MTDHQTTKPRVRELFFDDGSPAKVHLCTACEKLYDRPVDATCCEPMACACGAPRPKHSLLCGACSTRRDTEHEAERWAAATPRMAAGYDDPVYAVTLDGKPWKSGWFYDLAWLRSTIADHRRYEPDDPVPELHVYATMPRKMELDHDAIIDDALEDFYEDARDDISHEAEESLHVLLDAWAEANGPTMHEPDTSTRVIGWEVEP